MIKYKKIVFLLVLTLFLMGVNIKADAQGWTFTFSTQISGPCGAYAPQLPVFTIPYMPDKNTCESVRQTIVNISASQPVYDSYGNYIGDCKAYIVASACTGSDAAGAGTPGTR